MTVPVTAFNTFTVGETVPIYYEVYGLASGGEYRTRLSAAAARATTKVASTVSFTDRRTSSTSAASKALTLND